MSDRPEPPAADAIAPAPITPKPDPTPGEILRSERDKRGVLLAEVAREINLPENKLASLEQDDYKSLFSPTFVKGYLRSYCRYLELDSAAVIAAYDQYMAHLADTGVAVAPPPKEVKPLEKPFPEWSWAVLAGGVVVVLMAAFFIWLGGDSEPEQPSLVQSLTESGSSDDNQESSDPDDDMQRYLETTPFAENVSPGNAHASDTPAGADNYDDSQAGQDDDFGAETEQDSDDTASNERADSAPVTLPAPVVAGNAPKDELLFYFSDDCWVEIYDSAGQRLHQGLSSTGDTLTVVGNAPFSIMLGNAWVASLQLNGVTVAIEPKRGRNTLRFTVGDQL